MKRIIISRAILIAALVAPLTASGKPQADQKPADPPPAGSPPTADQPQPRAGELSQTDMQELAHFHHVNQMEIGLGKMAQEKGTAKVKAYGKMLVREHTRLDKGLTDLARQKKITISADQPADEAARAEMQAAMQEMERLRTMQGQEFDRAFLPHMVKDHQQAIARLDTAIANANDMKLRAALKKAQPVMKKHLAQAQKLAEGMTQETAKAPPPAPKKTR